MSWYYGGGGFYTPSVSVDLGLAESGDLIQVDFGAELVTIGTGITSTSREQFDTPEDDILGAANDGTNLILMSNTSPTIFLMVGFTVNVDSSFAAQVGGQGHAGLTVIGGTLVEGQFSGAILGDNLAHEHVGLTSSIAASHTMTSMITAGYTHNAAGDLVTSGRITQEFARFDGISDSEQETFTLTGNNGGIQDNATDGTNLLNVNRADDLVRIQDGFTGTVDSSFASVGTNSSGLTVKD